MSIFDKLAFWKHDPSLDKPISLGNNGLSNDDTGLTDEDLGLGDRTGLGDMGKQESLSGLDRTPGIGKRDSTSHIKGLGSHFEPVKENKYEQPDAFNKLDQTVNQPGNVNNNSPKMEIIESKIDTVKAMLENLTHKINKIEKIAEGEEEQKGSGRW
jgi:hypothetical protein